MSADFCVRVKFEDDGKQVIILGRLLNENTDFIKIETGKGNIVELNRKIILSIEHTSIIFKRFSQGGDGR